VKSLILCAMITLLFWTVPAQSQMFCGYDHQAIKDGLEKKYGEVAVNMGNTKDNHLTLLFLSRKTQTWSILDIDPNGPTCIISSGYNWEIVDEKILGDPS
jgi:hypothetical protein